MSELFRRSATVDIGGQRILSSVDVEGNVTGLDLEFEVERTLKREPNKCSLRIINQSEESRRRIQELRKVSVKIQAGYGIDSQVLIFQGDLREVTVRRADADLVTEVNSGDGERAHRHARVSASFGKNAKLTDVVNRLVQSLGADVKASVGSGNVREKLEGLVLQGASSVFAEGAVLFGNTSREFDNILKSAGVSTSVQNGRIQVLGKNECVGTTAAVLTFDTGLLDAPEKSSDKLVRANALIMPGLDPGQCVEFKTDEIEGRYRVETVIYRGSTSDGQWSAELECKEI